MAAVLDLENEWYVDDTTTTPVILGNHVLGRDYYLIRRPTSTTSVKIRSLVIVVGAGTCTVAANNGVVNGIVPDTPFNRRQLEKDNSADWSYALSFAKGTIVEIAIPINNLVVSALWEASSGNIDHGSGLETDGTGMVHVLASGGVNIGKPLCKITDGTGNQVIPMVLFASAVSGVVKA